MEQMKVQENKSLVGKEFTIVATLEDYTVLQEDENGYLLVQNSSFKRAGMQAGKEVIHKSEVDGVVYKWHQ